MKQLQQEILRSVAAGTLSKDSAGRLLRAATRQQAAEEPVAVVGLAGRWPGADDPDGLWRVLRSGEFQTRPFPEGRRRAMAPWMRETASAALLAGAWLDDVDGFDAERFGLAPRDAELIDPVQRLFLETAWHGLRDAVGDPASLQGRPVGVFAGCCPGSDDLSYWQLIQRHAPGIVPIAFTGNLPSMLPGRVSHALDLRGPSQLIDTACSSSLMAVHAACQALRAGECEMAVAGGVKVHLFPLASTDQIGIESPDGLTRSFAGGPSGTGVGEGMGVVVLKPLRKALADGDRIHAVIAGSAANQDGRTAGLTVPSVAAQQAVLEAAWRAAGIGAADIGCVEAHGTGTRLGDPIEFEALSRALRAAAPRGAGCALGSAKTVFGHLDSAAGITGLIKAVLMVRHGEIAPNLHFAMPNERIDYLGAPLYVNDRVRPWPADAGRYCGVSAFSMAGANCHVVVGPAPSHHPAPRVPVAAAPRRRRHWFGQAPATGSPDDRSPPIPTTAPAADPHAGDIVTRAWVELLGPAAAGDDADFFQCGGDSLKAAVLASRLARDMQRTVGVSQLWRTPTLGALRRALHEAERGAQQSLPVYPRQSRYAPTPAQKHMMLHAVLHRDTLYNMPFGLALDGAVDAGRLLRRAALVAEADAGLRVRFALQGGQPAMLPADGAALEIDQVALSGADALPAAAAAFIRPFDIHTGPLVRLRLAQSPDDRAWLLMDFHHLVMDGVSVAVFVDRLARALRASDDDAAASAAAPARTALDHVQWFATRQAASDFDTHRRHWASRFAGRGPGRCTALAIPQAGDVTGARLTRTLDRTRSASVLAFARRSGAGLFATVLGALAMALHASGGQRHFNIGTPFSGRRHEGTEDVLGMFVNLLPMAIDIDPEAALPDWLGALRSDLSDAMDVQDGPIDLVAPEPGPLREALGFNVAFALQNMALGTIDLGDGVRATPLPFYELPWNVAKFDLTLFAMEVDEQLVLSFERRASSLSQDALDTLAHHVAGLLDRFAATTSGSTTPRPPADAPIRLADCLPLAAPAPAPRPVLHF